MRYGIIGGTFLLSVAGGGLFYLLHIPMPWMLGPVAFVIVWSQVLKKTVYWPVALRSAALVILGYVIGKSFTAETARQILAQLPIMLAVTVVILAMSLVLGYVTHRRTGISLSTGLMGCVPGGFSQMVLMSEEIPGADVSVISFMHTIRLLTVIFVVPYLATQASGKAALLPEAQATVTSLDFGPISASMLTLLALALGCALLARKLRCPMPFLLGPILGIALASITGIECPALPNWLTIVSQISFGAYMGTQIQVANLSNWRSLLFYTMLGVVLVIAVSLGTAYFISDYYGYSNVTSFLSMAPGGVAEMSVTGIALQADLSVIASYQLFRLFFMLVLTPFLLCKCLKGLE